MIQDLLKLLEQKGNKEPSKDYKLTKSRTQVIDAFNYFVEKNIKVLVSLF